MRMERLALPLAIAGVLVVGALAALLAFMAPEKTGIALVAALTLPLLWGAIEMLTRGDKTTARVAVVAAAAMLALSLGLKAAQTAQLIAPDEGRLAMKLFGVTGGFILAYFGNRIPKILERYDSVMDVARRQAFQRMAGWIFVLAGVGSALAWLVLPIDRAPFWATLVVGGATALVLARLFQCRLRGRRA